MNHGSSGTSRYGAEESSVSGTPRNWKEAIPSLIFSRIGIFRIEAQEALAVTIRKLVFLGMAVFFLLATWVLLVSGLVGLISVNFKWAWYFVALWFAAGHLLVGLVMLSIIRRSKKIESFPITREEFEKDQQWLNQLKNHSSSQS